MSGLRVYELAKELKLDAGALVTKLEELGIRVKSHASSLTEDQAKKIREAIAGANPREVEEKRVRPGVIRRRVMKAEPVPEAKAEPEAPEAIAEPSEPAETQAVPPQSAQTPQAPSAAAPSAQPVAQQHPAQAAAHPAPSEKPHGKKKKSKKPIEAVIISRPATVKPIPISRHEKPELPGPLTEVPSMESLIDRPAPPTKMRMPYLKPLLAKEKITRLVQPIEPDEALELSQMEGTASAEDKKKKKAKKKGAKEVVETPEVKKAIKKVIGRKREIITKRDMVESVQRMYIPGKRKKKPLPKKMMKKTAITTPKAQKRIIKISGGIQVGELAHRMGIKSGELIKKLIDLGHMASINQTLTYDEAVLVAGDYGYEVENVAVEEEGLIKEEVGLPEDRVRRPPVVTVMGHVDHGKTTLLDTIRRTNVVDGEKGGITQHIGAYTIQLPQGKITFIDTPGHEAFTAMRARGAKVTDIVVLVVAADDGVMDRTKEAISHARAAEVPIIVAVNKVDKPEANPDRVKRQLADLGLNPEEWGGDTLFASISAKKNIGVKELLDSILLQAEMQELTANPKVPAKGFILEAMIDRGRGPVATALVQEGVLKAQDILVCGRQWGRVRAMLDDNGNPVTEAPPSTAVQILGLGGVPQAGDEFIIVRDERLAKQVVERRDDKARAAEAGKGLARVSLEDLYEKIQTTGTKELNIVLKADVQGSLEAVSDSLKQLSNEKCRVNVIHSGVGQVTENDIMLASASQAIVVGFNVKAEVGARRLAEQEIVQIRVFGIIYELLDDVQKAMLGTLEPVYKEKVIGHAEVRNIFPISKVGKIAGCYVADGKIQRNAKARLLRKGKEIWVGNIGNLKRFKEDAREVAQANECGIMLENFSEFEEGDVIEVYVVEALAPTM